MSRSDLVGNKIQIMTFYLDHKLHYTKHSTIIIVNYLNETKEGVLYKDIILQNFSLSSEKFRRVRE